MGCSVVHALVPIEGLVEGPPVALGLHEPGLDLPLLEVVGHPICQVVVGAHVAEVIELHILHSRVVAVWERDVLRRTQMLILLVMGCGHKLETVSHKVAVELHKHTDQSKVVGRDVTFRAAIALIPEREVVRGLQPVIKAINSKESVELVRAIELLKELSETTGCQIWVSNT